MRVDKAFGAAIALLVLYLTTGAVARQAPLESPSGGSCFEWKYPDKSECGELKGKTECKAKATIEASDDEKKKEACKPTKGDECFCD